MEGPSIWRPDKEIGEEIERIRNDRGETQGVFAGHLGLKDHAQVSKWEHGKGRPTEAQMLKIAELAGEDPRDLFVARRDEFVAGRDMATAWMRRTLHKIEGVDRPPKGTAGIDPRDRGEDEEKTA